MSNNKRYGWDRNTPQPNQQNLFAADRSSAEGALTPCGGAGPSSGALYSTLVTLISRLDRAASQDTDVIEWGSPIASFGNLLEAKVATIGLNPSNREFVDDTGRELTGRARRFHSLSSLGLTSWLDADARHLQAILASLQCYFTRNPYDTWFKRLDSVLSGIPVSFYGPTPKACHLDLIPFATKRKWMELSPRQRAALLSVSGDTLGLLLRNSQIEIVVLNGRSVVDHFQDLLGIQLAVDEVAGWALRRGGSQVGGYGFRGSLYSIQGTPLDRELLVLGYNHNLQSSFGVTLEVISAIRDWLSRSLSGRL